MGEGGGQILRTTLALSAATLTPVKIVNIRAKRRNPGLARQHMTAVKAVAAISRAEVEGLTLGSTTLVFKPRELRGGSYRFDIGTAGSVTLVLQAIAPLVPFLPEPLSIELRGGTDVPWSPTIDYVKNVYTWFLVKMGLHIRIRVTRRGHYPRGGGIVHVEVQEPPGMLRSISMEERGEVRIIKGRSHAVRLPSHVAVRQARAAEALLAREGFRNVSIELEYYKPGRDPHLGSGSGITLWAEAEHSVLGADALGARGKPAEKVGEEAAEKLVEDLRTGAALDTHMADMIIPLAGLAHGTTRVTCARMTLHAATNLEVTRMILGVDARASGKSPCLIEVRGMGLEAARLRA